MKYLKPYLFLLLAMVFSSTTVFSKPKIHYHFDNIAHFLFGSYWSVSQTAIYGFENGQWVPTDINVSCIGNGSEKCRAVFRPNGADGISEPEILKMETMFAYIKDQIESGINAGNYSQPISISGPDGVIHTSVITMTWNVISQNESTLDIEITEF